MENISKSRCGRPGLAWVAGLVVAAFLTGPAAAASPARHSDGPGFGGVLHAVRVGYALHDVGVFGRSKEDGNDYNVEFVFERPDFLRVIWSPYPVIGATINDTGDTSQIYGGLTWEWWFLDRFFFGFTFGLSGHNGETAANRVDRKDLGTEILFREAMELGWNFYKRDSISLYLDHVSQGNLFNDENEGLDTAGVRYTYRF